MKSRLVRNSMIVLLSLYCQLVAAVSIPDLYQASVPVLSRNAEIRQQAVKDALVIVLSKVSGQTLAADNPLLAQALAQPNRFVQQYRYQEVATQSIGLSRQTGFKLQVDFQSGAIQQILQELGLSVWGENRPLMMMWLAIEAPGMPRHVVGVDSDPAITSQIQSIAGQWGVPIVLPVLDLADLSQITVTDVWGQFPSALKKASERYGSDLMLVGRLQSIDGESWSLRWQLVLPEQSTTIAFDTTDWQTALNQGLSQVTAQLANHYGVSVDGGQSRAIQIVVESLESLPVYAKLLSYLRQLPQVEGLKVTSVSRTQVQIEITPKGTDRALRQAVALDKHLIPLSQSMESDSVLRYRFLP